VFEVTELVNFYYGITWNTSRKNLFDWNKELISPPTTLLAGEGSSSPERTAKERTEERTL
jgi:hypothetical protein